MRRWQSFMFGIFRASFASGFCWLGCGGGESSLSSGNPENPLTLPSVAGDGGLPDGSVDNLECSEELKQIYVVSNGGREVLYRFEPRSLTFTRLFDLGVTCSGAAGVTSMGVSRDGTAYIHFDQSLWKLDLQTGACVATRFVLPDSVSQDGKGLFGMGFSKVSADASADERLYIQPGSSLASVDLSSFEVKAVGSNAFATAELTGTGSGELFGFDISSGVVARLDKSNGSVVGTRYRTSAAAGTGDWSFAFAQWGGDFWLFTSDSADGSKPARVTRYSPETNTSEVVVADVGFSIIGAGSSTCAPSRPIR